MKKFLPFIRIILGIVIGFYFLQANYGWNNSPSMPTGIYKKLQLDDIKKGDIVILKIPENAEQYIHGRNYLPQSTRKLLKRVAGVPKDNIEIRDNKLFINNVYVKEIKERDTRGFPLPKIEGSILRENEYFLLGDEENSFDSAYFGAVKREQILNKAEKIIDFKRVIWKYNPFYFNYIFELKENTIKK